MVSLAAELTDRVVPHVPVRQFVLSVPHQLRYLLAYDHDRCTAVLRIFIRALLAMYKRRARRRGIRDGRTGTVTFIQRFGSAANLNLHFHVVALDGVFHEGPDGAFSFEAAETPDETDVHRLVEATRTRVLRHLRRRGVLEDDAASTADTLADETPALASCYAGSVSGRQTIGRRQGAKLHRIGADPNARWVETKNALHAHIEGFDLHASRSIHAEYPAMRLRLEDLLRYCARPPISDKRLGLRSDGNVVLQLKTPWRDGTTHIVYEPLDFVAKLAALIPRPRKNLLVYHGVLAANSAWRARVVEYGRDATPTEHEAREASQSLPRHMRRQWAEVMRRGLCLDVLECPKCGGRMKLLALISERRALNALLAHAGLPTDPPRPARPPPVPDVTFDDVA